MYDTIFSLSALIRSIGLKPCDLVFAVGPPAQLGLAAWCVARIHRARLFFHLQDIASRAASGTGMVSRRSVVARVARWVEAMVHRRADLIGVICDAFVQHLVSTGVSPDKIVYFPNYIDTHSFGPATRSGTFRARHGLNANDFVIMYSGGISQKQGLDALIASAALLSSSPAFRFFIIGEGSAKHDLVARVTAERVQNVTILPLQPKRELAEQLSAADVLVLTQRSGVTDAVFPSKLLPYMACERAIVAAAPSESATAKFIQSWNVGLVVPPDRPDAMADALLYLAAHPTTAAEFGRNGRRTVADTFEKRIVLQRVSQTLLHLATSRR